MKTNLLRALTMAGALALMGAAAMDPFGCDNPQNKDTPNPYLQEQDRVCGPGTHVDEAQRLCVCN